MIPVKFLLDDTGEAQHTRRFCSLSCREHWKPNPFEVEIVSTEDGFEDDVGVDGECCETCGVTIENVERRS